MSNNSISDELIIETSARLSNKVGLDNLSLKMIAEELGIKSPSLAGIADCCLGTNGYYGVSLSESEQIESIYDGI